VLKSLKPRILLMILLLLAAAGLDHAVSRRSVQIPSNRPMLGQTFLDVQTWTGRASLPIDEAIINELKLDDYLFRTYTDNIIPVTLYIGYYQTAAKVGAAHDPLVCFQGQGWKITSRGKGQHRIAQAEELVIDYATIETERENSRELIVYWFQTADGTSNNTFSQKLKIIWQRLTGSDETNAFVRINAPIVEASKTDVRQAIFSFIDQFYPQFQNYITASVQ
jgi:EpsI family protein